LLYFKSKGETKDIILVARLLLVMEMKRRAVGVSGPLSARQGKQVRKG